MRSSIVFLTATALAELIAATPLEHRSRECITPQAWHVCGDGWSGCCSVSPCKGPLELEQSGCPDDTPRPETTAAPSTSTPCSTSSTPIFITTPPTPTPVLGLTPDMLWTERCKEDDSNCNWNATFYSIETSNETYAWNTSLGRAQFYTNKNTLLGHNRESIAVFRGIPDHVTKCRISSYKPQVGAYWAVYMDGALNITTLDMGGKPFEEAIGGPANYKNTKPFIKDLNNRGVLDLANGEARLGYLDNSQKAFDCTGSEVVVHFSHQASLAGSIIFDQVSAEKGNNNGAVLRSGWVILYGEGEE